MTLDETLETAAFWHAGICLACGTLEEEFDDDNAAAQVCEECERGVVVSGRMLSRFIERLEGE